MELEVINREGESTGKKVTLADAIYAIEPNDHVIYLDVKQHLANRRQGTHKAKERAEIVGSTKKLKKQKGTGTARAGSIKSPLFRGGGRIFGPRPRDYHFKLNRKVKSLARKSALTYKAKENNITVVEDFNLEAPKTQDYQKVLNNISEKNEKTLLILPDHNKNLYLSSRNLPKAKVLPCSQINTFELLNADKVLIFESSVEQIENLFN
ncbi:50S ribosomal protein L4 [Microscilla marina]|uniref:Large ribosomal subunit protein uL4 n=1 Tax=Microscilla marina ATCC 23134 TaxID=313606 RepID=A1ZGR6_MICM2|nr:50S ribosomal protein L4 [Microscilla marina]EAY30185.1 ribosomal protein L4/L1 family [Microscilla marina ATCC 23134]